MGIRSNLYRMWKMFSEKKLRNHYKEHYKTEIEYFNSYPEKKPKGLMKKEMKMLHKYWGCYPFQYIRYGMYKKSCKMDMNEMKQYVPNYFAYYLFFPKYFKEYGLLTEDKEITYRIFDSYKINQPVFLLHYKNGFFYDLQKNKISDNQTNQIINSSKSRKLFFKPTLGLGGKGIFVFNKTNNYINKNGDELTAGFIRKTLSEKEDYILQEGLEQHPELNKIYPTAINTFRVMTKMNKGNCTILYAMLRMGQGGSQLDNASQHGLVCKVNIKTGAFNSTGNTGLGKTLDAHPDSGFVFKGYVFPYWENIVNFVTTAAEKMESIGFIGWDVAYTVNGPIIIEMNAGAGLEYLQDCHGGVKEGLGIDHPKKYWYSNNFAIKDL
jgi:hypothetical protein